MLNVVHILSVVMVADSHLALQVDNSRLVWLEATGVSRDVHVIDETEDGRVECQVDQLLVIR